jgi:chaperonin GroEL (HSP60 family)
MADQTTYDDASRAGDRTTTATVLAHAIYQGIKNALRPPGGMS